MQTKKEKVTFLKQSRERNEGSKKESVYRRNKHEKGEEKGKRCQKKRRGIFLAQHNMTTVVYSKLKTIAQHLQLFYYYIVYCLNLQILIEHYLCSSLIVLTMHLCQTKRVTKQNTVKYSYIVAECLSVWMYVCIFITL